MEEQASSGSDITAMKPFTAQWLLYVPHGLTLKTSAFFSQTVFTCMFQMILHYWPTVPAPDDRRWL
jgi:hypothetical protein